MRTRRPRRAFASFARIAIVAAVALVAASCTVPSDDEARPIDPTRLESTQTNKQNCTAPSVDLPSTAVQVYLVSQLSEPPQVKAVDRYIANPPATAFAALNALFNCRIPDDDRRNGLATLIPEETQLLALVPSTNPDQAGVYTVQLGPLRNSGAQKVDDLDKVAVAQIFFTATQPRVSEQIVGLKFTVDGRSVAVSTDVRTVGQNDWVRREDFRGSSPQTTTTTASLVTTTTAPSFTSTSR